VREGKGRGRRGRRKEKEGKGDHRPPEPEILQPPLGAPTLSKSWLRPCSDAGSPVAMCNCLITCFGYMRSTAIQALDYRYPRQNIVFVYATRIILQQKYHVGLFTTTYRTEIICFVFTLTIVINWPSDVSTKLYLSNLFRFVKNCNI